LLVAACIGFVTASSASREPIYAQGRPSPTDSGSPSPSPTYTAAPPDVTPTSNDFGTVCAGTSSSPFEFTLENPDQVEDLVVQTVRGTWPFVAGSPADGTVPPGASTTFPVTYRPDASGPQEATIEIDTNHGSTSVDVSGTGLDKQLSVAPTTLSFGALLKKTTSAPRTVTIANTGSDPLTVAAPVLSGSDAFTMTPADGFTLPGNTSRRITIVFSPKADGDLSATITVVTDACVRARRTIVLTGSGAEPAITARPESVQPSAEPGSTGHPELLTVSSSGGVPLHVTKIQLTGPGASAFTLSGVPRLPATLAPGVSAILKIAFTAARPPALPPPTASVEISSDDPKTPVLTVPIEGVYATPTPKASASPSATPTAATKTGSHHGGGISGYTSVIVVMLLVAGAFVALWLWREEKTRRVLRRALG